MAGFTGIYGSKSNSDSVRQGAELTVYAPHTKVTSLHQDANLVLYKSFVTFLESPDSTARIGDVTVWIDGEIYNRSECTMQHQTFAETLLQHYQDNTLGEFLRRLDGIFIVIIYDATTHQVVLISDRYGLKPFYLSVAGNQLTFAPELKCFSVFKPFDLKIRKDVIDCFIGLEHLLGTTTWLEGVTLIKPAAIVTYSLREHKLTTTQYWSWSQIRRTSLSFDDAAEQIGLLLDAANKKRFFGDYQVGVALSGGLDSRAIVAAVHDQKPVTYTFGLPNSQDVIVAQRVAHMANVSHTWFDIRTNDWLSERFSGVWKTDGMLNMYHMHYSHLMNRIREIMAVNLSGFLGDVVLGGSYMNKKGKVLADRRVDASLAEFYYGQYAAFSDPDDSFFDIDKVDPYVMYNRGRRMIGMGAEEANKTIPQRLPFMDTALMDFAYSLPDDFRVKSKVYDKALLQKYPEFYRTIPNAGTRVPIHERSSIVFDAVQAFHRGIDMVKYKLGIATSYTDVYNWIKEPVAAKRIGELLDVDRAIYPNFTSRNFKREFLDPHVQGKGNYMKQVMGALTLEIWLQQLLNRKFIPDNHQS